MQPETGERGKPLVDVRLPRRERVLLPKLPLVLPPLPLILDLIRVHD